MSRQAVRSTAADRSLTSIAAAGSPTVSFSIDALGRHASQTISGSQTTYAYLGTSNSITTLTAASTTYSIIDAVGNRLATSSGGVTGYLVPDLHGNVAASVSTGSSPSFLSAFRYDAYGETCDSYNAGGNNLAVPWRYQGRIRESASSATDLYDFGARSYDPSLGAFTSFDSVSGSALNPLSLNRYLYALANPASLIDPSGHSACVVDNGDYSKCYDSTNGGSAVPEMTPKACTADSGNFDRCYTKTNGGGHLMARRTAVGLKGPTRCSDPLGCLGEFGDHTVRSFAYAPVRMWEGGKALVELEGCQLTHLSTGGCISPKQAVEMAFDMSVFGEAEDAVTQVDDAINGRWDAVGDKAGDDAFQALLILIMLKLPKLPKSLKPGGKGAGAEGASAGDAAGDGLKVPKGAEAQGPAGVQTPPRGSIGTYAQPDVWVERGGMPRAQEVFDQYSAGGVDITPPGYGGAGGGRLIKLPDGSTVGIRNVSKSDDPVVEFDGPDGYWRVHFGNK